MSDKLMDDLTIAARDYAADAMISEAKRYAKARPTAGSRTVYRDGNFIKGYCGRLAGRWITQNGDFFPTRRLAVADAEAFKLACIEYLQKEGAL